MPFSQRTRYLLVLLAVSLAAGAEFWYGTRLVIVIAGAVGFLAAGCVAVYRSGAKQRAIRRKQRLDYWTNGQTDDAT